MTQKNKSKRDNIYFRQTPKEFRSARQTQIWQHINKNLPYRIYQFSKYHFLTNLNRLKNQYNKVTTKFPKNSRKIKNTEITK